MAGGNNNPAIPANRIILGGFSQGGALSLYTGLTSSLKLGGIVSMSGYLPIGKTIDWTACQKIPILQCHGDSDTVVNYEFAQQTAKVLSANIPKHTLNTYRGMDHCSCPEELRDVENFIKEIIPPI
jgi:lysophospholipase-2